MTRSWPEWRDLDSVHHISHVKRFEELCRADPEFVTKVREDPNSVFATCGLSLDPESVRPLWDPRSASAVHADSKLAPPLLLFREFLESGLTRTDLLRQIDGCPNSAYTAWRRRQIARCREEIGQSQNSINAHAPLAIEISDGCSVGCWFCGLGARPLTGWLTDSDADRERWRRVLTSFSLLLGPAMRAAFCYWATDPLDNPAYEVLSRDFADVVGVFPHITTALAPRDPERTRRLLADSERHGRQIHRFSVLSVNALRRIHEQFTPEELLFVDLVFQIPGRITLKARAGHARSARPHLVERESFGESATIACVSGWLVNMVTHEVRLISPCRPDDDRPLGYTTHSQGIFADAADLEQTVRKMIDEQMVASPPRDEPLRIQPHLRLRELDDGICLDSDLHALHRRVFRGAPWWPLLGRLLASGKHTPAQAVSSLGLLGVGRETVESALQRVFDRGVLVAPSLSRGNLTRSTPNPGVAPAAHPASPAVNGDGMRKSHGECGGDSRFDEIQECKTE